MESSRVVGSDRFRTEQSQLHLLLYTVFGKHPWSNWSVVLMWVVELWQWMTFPFDNDTSFANTPGKPGQPALNEFDFIRNPFFLVTDPNALRFIIAGCAALSIALWIAFIYVYKSAGLRSATRVQVFLRYTTRVLLGGGYFPIMVMFNRPFRCTAAGTWLSYDISCTTGEHAALIGAAIIGFCTLGPYLVLTALANVDYSMIPSHLGARSDGRYHVVYMTIKIALGMFYSLNTYNFTNAFVSIIAIAFLMYYTLAEMPFHSPRMMYGVMIMYTNVLVALVGALVLLYGGTPMGNGGMVALIIVIVGWIPGTFIGWGLMRMRYKSLRRHADRLCEAVAKWRDLESGLAERQDRELENSVWHPYAFASPSEVLPCVLFYAYSADEAERRKGADVIAVAEKQYPRDTRILNVKVNYYLHVVGNTTLAMMTGRKAAHIAVSMDYLYLARCVSYDALQQMPVELGGNGGMDVMTFMTYHVNLYDATHQHRIAFGRSLQFWKALSSESPDTHTIANMLWGITQAETRAEDVYLRMLKKFPDSRPLLHHYSQFLLHLKHDERLAAHYQAKAERLEGRRDTRHANNTDDDATSVDERSSTNNSPAVISQKVIKTRGVASIPSPRSGNTKHTAYESREKDTTMADVAASSEIKVKSHAASMVTQASWVVSVLTVVAIVVGFTFFMLTAEGYKIGLDNIDSAAGRCEKLQRPLLIAQNLFLSAVDNDTDNTALYRAELQQFVGEFRAEMQAIRTATFRGSLFEGGGSNVDAVWTNTSIPVTITTSTFGQPVVTMSKMTTFWEATNGLLDASAAMAALPSAQLGDETNMFTEPNYRYLLDNTMGLLTLDCPTMTQQIRNNVDEGLTRNIEIQGSVLGVAFVVTCVIMFFRMHRYIKQAHDEHISAVQLFFELPRTAVSSIYARTLALASEANGFNSDSSSGRGSSSSGHSSTSSTSTISGEDGTNIGTKSLSLVSRLTFQRIVVMLVTLAFFSIYVGASIWIIPLQGRVLSTIQDIRVVSSDVRSMQLYLIQVNAIRNRVIPLAQCKANLSRLITETMAALKSARLGPTGIDGHFDSPYMYAGTCAEDGQCVALADQIHSRKGLYNIAMFVVERSAARLGLPPTAGDQDEAQVMDGETGLMMDSALLPTAELLIGQLKQAAADSIKVTEIILSFVFFLNIVFFVIVKTVVYPRMSQHLLSQAAKTTAMLRMVPPDIISQVDEIRWFLHDVTNDTVTTFKNSERTALCVIGVNENGEVVRAFRGLTETLGYRANALDGESVHTLFPDLFAARAGKEQGKFSKNIATLLSGKVLRTVYDAEHSQQSFRVGAIDSRGDYGNDIPYKICLYTVNQTTKARGEALSKQSPLQLSAAILKGALDYSSEAFLVVNEIADIVYASRGAVTLFDCSNAAELQEQRLEKLFVGQADVESLMGMFEAQASEGAEVCGMTEIYCKGGKRLQAQLRVASLNEDGNGHPYLLMLSTRSSSLFKAVSMYPPQTGLSLGLVMNQDDTQMDSVLGTTFNEFTESVSSARLSTTTPASHYTAFTL